MLWDRRFNVISDNVGSSVVRAVFIDIGGMSIKSEQLQECVKLLSRVTGSNEISAFGKKVIMLIQIWIHFDTS
jgi:hypothetical protein